jgi:hypothetical protein
MKKILIAVCLCVLIPMIVFAVCDNPLGQQYSTDGLTLEFKQGYPPGPDILRVNVDGADYFYPYVWDADRCVATVETEPPIYLELNGLYLDISMTPRFLWAPVTSVD